MTTSIFASRSGAYRNFTQLVGRWLLLDAYGRQAQFHMTIVWSTLAGFVIVEPLWLLASRLSFANSNWEELIRLALCIAIAFGLCGFAAQRLAGANDSVGRLLSTATARVELFATATLVFGLLVVFIITYCCLGAAAGLVLQDERLAGIDRWMGFDWAAFVKFANASAPVARLLTKAYQSTGYILTFTLAWLCVTGQGSRLAEFLAIMCLAAVGIAIGMMMLPAAGAYSFYKLPLSSYENFGADAGMWHYDLLMALRNGAASVIDFSTPNSNCLVTFPSGHTILGVITTYALRGSRWTLIPALLINAAMVVSTIPEGGHHLFDLVVGGAIAVAAILIVRRPLRSRSRQDRSLKRPNRSQSDRCGNLGPCHLA